MPTKYETFAELAARPADASQTVLKTEGISDSRGTAVQISVP